LSYFQRGQTVGTCLPVAPVTMMATLLGALRAPVSKVKTAYTYHGKSSTATRNSGQKPKLSEGDYVQKS
jgi:hypothetical protein